MVCMSSHFRLVELGKIAIINPSPLYFCFGECQIASYYFIKVRVYAIISINM